MKKIILWSVGIMVIFTIFFILQPAPIDPAAYTPADAPEFLGVLEANNLLQKAELLAVGEIQGPEEVAVDSHGRIYAGTQDGKIMRLLPDGHLEVFAETKGRPLGIKFDKDENLVVCDSYKGLLSIDPAGNIKVLATTAEGVPFKFTNALDISEDGTIYFTDASSKYGQNEYLYDLLESRPHGRFMAYNPATGKTEVILKDLYFANGVALSRQEDFVLINETSRYRILRYWLKGPKAGTHDIFIDNLPGFPDNISPGLQGRFWVGLAAPRVDILDRLSDKPLLRKVVQRLPSFVRPDAVPSSHVIAITADGQVLMNLQDPDARFPTLTGVAETKEALYLTTLFGDQLPRLNKSDLLL